MLNLTREQKIYHILRIAVAMCFIGHGAFGIITKPIWCNYFAVFGIGQDTAYRLMPTLGAFDILMGLFMLVYPVRAILVWLVIWGVITAALRPASGEPFAEFIERAGNFGAPFVLLMLTGGMPKNFKSLFTRMDAPSQTDTVVSSRIITCLRVIVFLLLAGHGWLNLVEKKGLIGQYSSMGFTNPAMIAKYIGAFEIFSAFAVLIKPFRPMVLGLIAWKIISEFFYPHYELFEWIERGGSYGCLLALWFALDTSPARAHRKKFQAAT